MDFWQTYGLSLAILVVAIVLGSYIIRRGRGTKADVVAAEEAARAEYDSMPKCVCGELARFPAPVLQRDRGAWDWLRNYFAAPPRYKRVVDMMMPPVFCAAHAHVADAMMDQFIFRIRGEFSNMNAKVASDSAGFEQEALLKQVADSLTENQKRAVRKTPSPIRVLPMKTGTDDAISDG